MKTETEAPSDAAVIQLTRLGELDEFPAYVAIYSAQTIEHPFALSPVAMQWSEQIVLNRIADCEAFWIAQKRKGQCDFEHLFQSVVSHHYGDDFIAVFANHPWPCLLYLAYQCQQGSQGIYFLHSRLNRHIYQSLDWQAWFANQSVLAKHLDSIHARGFNAARFRARQAQLKRFIGRIGLAGPFELQQVDFQAFSRRFESWLAKIWRWTMTDKSDLQSFPWIPIKQCKPPFVIRELEYPVNQWQVVETLLREDLMRLCELFVTNAHEHINRMSWQIRLFNHQLIEVDLSFRHPYSLRKDEPDFKTALYQARYIYDDLIHDLQHRDKDLDLPETMPLVEWRIEICERFDLPPMIWDLFGRDSIDTPRQDLFYLQNKLSVAIESYTCLRSFYPELSFRLLPLDADVDAQATVIQWSSQSVKRPLFYYPAAQEIAPEAADQFNFLERCANHWWQTDDAQAINRDYYLLKGRHGKSSWVYRDHDGKWFKQGEYC